MPVRRDGFFQRVLTWTERDIIKTKTLGGKGSGYFHSGRELLLSQATICNEQKQS